MSRTSPIAARSRSRSDPIPLNSKRPVRETGRAFRHGIGFLPTLGITGFVCLTLFKTCALIWPHLREQDVHPVFVLLRIIDTLAILWFAVTRSLRSAWVRTVCAFALSAYLGYAIFVSVARDADYIWAGAALGVFGFFAFRFIRWAHEPEDELASVFFL